MQGFADLSHLPEDDRLHIVGRFAVDHPGKKIGVPTDDETGKAERYKSKLEKMFPTLDVTIVGRSGGIAVLHVIAPASEKKEASI